VGAITVGLCWHYCSKCLWAKVFRKARLSV